MDSKTRSLFIPKNELHSYVKEHNITLDFLNNGIPVIASLKKSSESVITDLQFMFQSGSYFDPKGKEGLHHLIEHLLLVPLRRLAFDKDVKLNAYTSYSELGVDLSGPIHSSYHDYGLLSIFPKLFAELIKPLKHLGSATDVMEYEKKVILTEINERRSNHYWLIRDTILKLIWSTSNPVLAETPGNTNSLKNINVHDLTDFCPEIFNADRLIIGMLSKGNKTHLQEFYKSLTKTFESFPQTKTKLNKLNWKLIDEINPAFTKGSTYTVKNDLNNNLMSIIFLWMVDVKEYSVEEFALRRYIIEIAKKIHIFSRKLGLGYQAGADFTPYYQKGLVTLRFDLSSQIHTLEGALKLIKPQLPSLLELSDEEISRTVEREQIREKVIPVTTKMRIGTMINGWKMYGKFIDMDFVKNQYTKISVNDIKKWKDMLLKEKPTEFFYQ